jgi:8-oxo-dGTP pyrophosphatase MutT (NUDIX family)
MVEIPDDLPLVERGVVRLVVLDSARRVLLFHSRDSTDPALGTCWELPGGGIDDGEDYVQAAIRELNEEAGLSITPEQLDQPGWQRDATYRYRGHRRLQHEQVALVHLRSESPPIDATGRDRCEQDDCFGSRWWQIDDIVSSDDRFYPGTLPLLLTRFLDGEYIAEPFEHWS